MVAMFFFFCNDTATTEIYTLSLHDALPISLGLAMASFADSPVIAISAHSELGGRDRLALQEMDQLGLVRPITKWARVVHEDRKSTRLNSSHANISYVVFCLKKKNYSKTCLH